MKIFLYTVVVILGLNYLSEATTGCVNGDIANDTCVCFPGWMGDVCDRCGGRIRLTNGSGVIADDVSGSQYSGNVQCMFLIETDRPASKVHLRMTLLHTECQWDYLHVFDGDSVFTQKLAAYTGNIMEQMEPATTNDSLPLTDQISGIVLSSTGPQILVYFYTDLAAEADGFEIDYWVDYACPINCSGHGECLDNGTCQCDTGWFGDLCDLPVCPNNCSSNGECDKDSLTCSCLPGYTGEDCSVDVELPFWSRVASQLPENLTLATLARASHSAVLWRDSVIIYGGYQFPQDGYSSFRPSEVDTHQKVGVQVLHFLSESGSWDVLVTSSSISSNGSFPLVPTPRYGHTAVVYNDTMYVFGGAKWPSEEIVNELWALDLQTRVWTPLFNHDPYDTEHDNTTLLEVGGAPSSVSIEPSEENFLPLPVRSHTAHVVGSKMIVLFGLSSGAETLISYVQEYDFDTGEWSAPPQRGFPVPGLMGHASAYNPETGLIYVEGGVIHNGDRNVVTTQLLEYNPVLHTWRNLTSSGSYHYLHSITMVGPLLVVFGGCQGSSRDDCYTNEMTVYNTRCDSWNTVEYSGLPMNSSRYGHSATLHQSSNLLLVFGGFFGNLHHDMLQLHLGNCSIHLSKSDCLLQSVFCAWSSAEHGRCVSVVEADDIESTSYNCDIDSCNYHRNCSECDGQVECSWSSESFRCLSSNSSGSDCSSAPSPVDLCSGYRQCQSCVVHNCVWNGSYCLSQSFQERNMTMSTCPSSSCFQATSCTECTGGDCLWCPSLNHCVPNKVYPFYYIHGQCLGWVSQSLNCSGNCSDYKTCGDCQNDPHCGWCNDASDTGLGECSEGGFTSPRNTSFCIGYNDDEMHERWFFEVCPACQCNGHSSCVNMSICEACQNNTDGDNCEICMDGFWGDSRNGGICNECDCNGYNSVCDVSTGVCECLSFGVTGNHCQLCDAVSDGDANNFCFSEMQVNFIYTYSVDMDREQEGFFIVTPPEDKDLNLKFEITSNPNDQIIQLQLFVGRKSENLWVLTNLTDPLTLKSLGSYNQGFNGFTSNSNSSLAQLYSFARPSLSNLANFTDIFNNAVENDYTSAMWDEDTTLVIYIFNLSSPMTFKITVDQQDFLFLLYFFITFITCFSVLLTAFLLGWYIRQKIMVRNMLRQQYIELQRRVARPFSRMKLQIDRLHKDPSDEHQPQNASYIGVETCRDNKAAILSLFIRLPGNQTTGRPVVGRSGLCVGSTLVKVNPSKKSKESNKVKKRKNNGSSNAVGTNTQSRAQTQNHSTSIPV